MADLRTYLWLLATIIAGFALAMIAFTSLAPAALAGGYCWDLGGCREHRVVKKRKARRAHRPRAERYYAPPLEWERFGDDGNRRPVCVAEQVEVISTEHTSRDNAAEAARKMWAASTQWKWGSQYMDLSLAREVRKFCGPSNAMDTMSTRLNEAVNTIVGKEGTNVRCVIKARPCRAIMEQAEGFR